MTGSLKISFAGSLTNSLMFNCKTFGHFPPKRIEAISSDHNLPKGDLNFFRSQLSLN